MTAALDVIATVLLTRAAPSEENALVRIDAESLAAHGLELRGVLSLVRDGTLKTIRIGRGRYTSTRHLAALVDHLDAASRPDPRGDDVAAAVERSANRRARRSAA